MILLILVELGCAAFIFFDKSWQEVSAVLIDFSKSKMFSHLICCMSLFVGNSNRQNWRFWHDICFSERALDNYKMGCSWCCCFGGKHNIVTFNINMWRTLEWQYLYFQNSSNLPFLFFPCTSVNLSVNLENLGVLFFGASDSFFQCKFGRFRSIFKLTLVFYVISFS